MNTEGNRKIETLKHIPLEKIVECILISFSDYFVQLPTDLDTWSRRFKGARIDYDLSFGTFVDDELVALIMTGVDLWKGELTAYNSCTGVIPTYRGKQLVDAMYQSAMPFFRQAGIERCMLEVIKDNYRAIKVYERIGFCKDRVLKCYKGKINHAEKSFQLRQVKLHHPSIVSDQKAYSYSWDNSMHALELLEAFFEAYLILNEDGNEVGSVVLDVPNGYIAQLTTEDGDYNSVLSGIASKIGEVRINNIDEEHVELISALETCGLENVIDQYEMSMNLNNANS